MATHVTMLDPARWAIRRNESDTGWFVQVSAGSDFVAVRVLDDRAHATAGALLDVVAALTVSDVAEADPVGVDCG